MSFAVGSLVRTRGREWVVLPESEDDFLVLRPLGGTDDEIAGIHLKLETVEGATLQPPGLEHLGDHRSGRLLRDAIRLGFRHSAGPFRSVARIACEPRPYQLVPLLMALRLDPVRLLIADDVGIGKTIEACLIARELLDRGEIERLAVLCPPHLAEQWQRELRLKFNLDCETVLASTARRLEQACAANQSLFEVYPHVIVSTDYIKSDRHREDFLRACPELVIVDEAHTCAATAETGWGRHQRHQLLEGLAKDVTRHLILVTATPHSGKEEAFRSLLSLLNPDFADLPDDLSGDANRRHRERLAGHLVQRRRPDIEHYLKEDTPFPVRESPKEDPTYRLHPEYRQLFEKALAFAREMVQDEEGGAFHQRIRWWSALALLRSLASSPAAAAAGPGQGGLQPDRVLPLHPDGGIPGRRAARRAAEERRGRGGHGPVAARRPRGPCRGARRERTKGPRLHRLPERGHQPPGPLRRGSPLRPRLEPHAPRAARGPGGSLWPEPQGGPGGDLLRPRQRHRRGGARRPAQEAPDDPQLAGDFRPGAGGQRQVHGRDPSRHAGLPPLGSFLWSEKATPDLDRCEMGNAALLEAIRSLAFTRDGKIRRTIDYRNLGAVPEGAFAAGPVAPGVVLLLARVENMIQEGHGNLLQADAEALVNTVNTVGHMGKGIALQFKQAFPENFTEYARAVKRGEVLPGRMFVHRTGSVTNPRFIINFPTKRHWRGSSRMADIESGLKTLVEEIRRLDIHSIAVPPLGCGNGGLDWKDVRPRIVAALGELSDVRVLLFAPRGAPAADHMPILTRRPAMTAARALLVKLMEQYSELAYRLTLLEIHKLAYFLQEAGEPLRLRYDPGHYGPYAPNLNKVLERIEGHLVRGYGDSQKPDLEIGLLKGAIDEADAFLTSQPESRERLARVARLIEGFETPYGMELLSSVHWVARNDPRVKTPADAVRSVHAWNERKHRMFSEPHVEVAWEQLASQGWIEMVRRA